MAQPDEQDHAVRHQDRGWTRWLSAGTFVLGVLAGVLLVGLLGQDPPTAAPSGPAAASAPADAPAATAEPTGRVEVNAACLRAINAAQDIAAAVEDLGTAAAALDAAQLDEAIRRLQPLQERLQVDTAACESTGSAPTEDLPPSPTPSAPASPPG
ncbi:hypothetical protein [Geodermatophilus normandii]|uniref:Uncharacterized protein n=1 Tax=Geodermatophilus normandii TaxID=1137989 RepID=A0A6P0GMT6_9ACTN|nr:hypothetical protein [Geodermatophilus normandii]NEM08271.1 hypothetical protein [Geodermatophilus normandii]